MGHPCACASVRPLGGGMHPSWSFHCPDGRDDDGVPRMFEHAYPRVAGSVADRSAKIISHRVLDRDLPMTA